MNFYAQVHLRWMESKEETAVTAAKIAPRTTPPATTELSKFFKDGVTAASATKGWAIMEATAAVTPATAASVFLLALHQEGGE